MVEFSNTFKQLENPYMSPGQAIVRRFMTSRLSDVGPDPSSPSSFGSLMASSVSAYSSTAPRPPNLLICTGNHIRWDSHHPRNNSQSRMNLVKNVVASPNLPFSAPDLLNAPSFQICLSGTWTEETFLFSMRAPSLFAYCSGH
jgi:hypothetical protein